MTHLQTQDDEALVEVMARAIWVAEQNPEPWAINVVAGMGLSQTGHERRYLRLARAALTALRNHEGRK